MKKLANIALMQMLLGGALLGDSSPYKPMYSHESKSQKSKSKKDKPLTKVVYCTDEKGQIRRKKVPLERAE